MKIKEINIQELRKMDQNEGLVLQGCGGELIEWVDGINKLLTKEEILLEGSRFENCCTFKNGESICMLFLFEDQKINMGRFAVWRIATNAALGGMWLSDFVDHYLGGFEKQIKDIKPDCPLIGADGNIFNLMGMAKKTLEKHGFPEKAQKMIERIEQSGSYAEALNIIGEYVNITTVDDEIEEGEEGVMMQA